MFNQTYHSLRAQVIEVEDQQYGGENVWVGHRLLWYFIYFTQKKSINFPLHLYNVLFVLYIKEQEKDHHFIIACSLYREKNGTLNTELPQGSQWWKLQTNIAFSEATPW